MSIFLRICQRNRVFRRERIDQTLLAAMTEVTMQAINEAEGQSIAAIIRNSLAKCNLFSLWPGGQSEFMTRLPATSNRRR
jgi:hypothetical protein